jgi:aminoglycoside phosphotransferase family enzyme/predicted kinase
MPQSEAIRAAMVSGDREQQDVIAFLGDPASYSGGQRIDRFETHGNLVFLAGGDAWKIKRAVKFPYMDFSTLAKRHAACIREVEINRRFGSALYLGCVPIVRSRDGTLAFGSDGDVVEWAVHMRRFDQSALLSNVARTTGISCDLARELADVVHEAHDRAERFSGTSGAAPLRELAASISTRLSKSGIACLELEQLARELSDRSKTWAATLNERAATGFVRRCHGDLHLANIVMWNGRPALYDAIEFDEAVATIDTLYDLAFLLMDLDRHDQRPAANIVLNRYLWRSQNPLDLRGLVALPLFLALRAAVRAMVTADRAAQKGREGRDTDLEKARHYLRAALGYLEVAPPRLVAVGGLSGTGKTTLAASLAPWLGQAPGAVHLRTDLERKRLAGVGELDRLPESAYSPEARKRVYDVLYEKARSVLATGHSVIVDAVFAEQDARQTIQALARDVGAPFHGIWLHADPEKLLGRVAVRRNDASDATPEVVRGQLQFDLGPFSAEWTAVDAGGTPAETLGRARAAIGVANTSFESPTE